MRTQVFSPTYPTWALVGGLQGKPAKLYCRGCPTSPLPLSTAIMRAVLPVTSSISTKLVTPPGSCLASTSASSSRTMSAVLSVQAWP